MFFLYLCKNYHCMKRHLLLLVLGLTSVLAGCGLTSDDQQEATQTAQEWAQAYFNYNLMEAADLSTAESKKWLQLLASNTTDDDLRLLGSNGATITVEGIASSVADTLHIVKVRVENYVKAGAIGEPSSVQEEGLFFLKVVKRNRGWYVRMEGLPQNEKQSRD